MPLPGRPVLVACLATFLVGAATPMPFRPGRWTFTNTPRSATLDGRVLKDLPVGAATSETTCLTPAQALDPAGWLARDLVQECTLMRRTVAGGRVDVAGTCPARDDGQSAGTLSLRGRYADDRYDLRFETVAHGENGMMGFGGTMVGQRIGDCSDEPPPR